MIRRNIPNLLTLMNLFCGLVAIVFVFRNELIVASLLVGIAAFFDFSDGFAARLLNVRSDIGLHLDSLADVVTFGVTPGLMMFVLMNQSQNLPEIYSGGLLVPSLVAFLLPLMSAVRLARFNTDVRQLHQFIGLPTPANALFIISLPLVAFQAEREMNESVLLLLTNYWFLAGITLLFSFLLISPIRMIAFKFDGKRMQNGMEGIVFLLVCAGIYFLLKFYAFPLMVVLYILYSIFRTLKRNEAR